MDRIHHLGGDGHEAEPASRLTEEQIIGILREQEAGAKTADVCRKHGVSSATFYALLDWGRNRQQLSSIGSRSIIDSMLIEMQTRIR